MRGEAPARMTRSAGFSLAEVMVVVALIAVTVAMSVLVMPGAIATARSDSAVQQLVSVLRTAREQAIAQRRLVRVEFNAPNEIVVFRVEQPSGDLTELTRVVLEHGFEFRTFGGVPDTPDGFGNAGAVDFGEAASVQFTSEGTFVDDNGDEINGSVFIGRANDVASARAVTIFGPTALIRQWHWRGNDWHN